LITLLWQAVAVGVAIPVAVAVLVGIERLQVLL
jgi:hypothetical protein